MVWIGFTWYGVGTVRGLCEHGNELSGSIKCCEILERLAVSQEGPSSVELVSKDHLQNYILILYLIF
jgi:hypothetical protein